MSWLFSRALVEASSAANCSAGEPSAQLSSTPMPQAFLWRDKTTDAWRRFRSGMTCEPSTADHGKALLTSFLVAFHVRTSARRARAKASKARALASGEKWRGSLARYDRDSSSWRTLQCSLLAGSELFSATWPRWGSMRSGECSERPILVRRTFETVSGFLPTPTATDFGSNRGGQAGRTGPIRYSLMTMARKNKWPTPKARDWKRNSGNRNSPDLPTAVKWATPTVHGNYNRKGASKNSGDGLATQVAATEPAGGPLNPTWVEWLMGWPLGWTDCAQSATGRFLEWQRLHGDYSHGEQDSND